MVGFSLLLCILIYLWQQHGEKKIQQLFSEAANTKILNVY